MEKIANAATMMIVPIAQNVSAAVNVATVLKKKAKAAPAHNR